MNDTPIFDRLAVNHDYQCSACEARSWPVGTFTCEACC